MPQRNFNKPHVRKGESLSASAHHCRELFVALMQKHWNVIQSLAKALARIRINNEPCFHANAVRELSGRSLGDFRASYEAHIDLISKGFQDELVSHFAIKDISAFGVSPYNDITLWNDQPNESTHYEVEEAVIYTVLLKWSEANRNSWLKLEQWAFETALLVLHRNTLQSLSVPEKQRYIVPRNYIERWENKPSVFTFEFGDIELDYDPSTESRKSANKRLGDKVKSLKARVKQFEAQAEANFNSLDDAIKADGWEIPLTRKRNSVKKRLTVYEWILLALEGKSNHTISAMYTGESGIVTDKMVGDAIKRYTKHIGITVPRRRAT